MGLGLKNEGGLSVALIHHVMMASGKRMPLLIKEIHMFDTLGARSLGCSLLSVALLAGCCSIPDPKQVSSVPVSDVLNAVKDELAYYRATKPTVTPRTGACYNQDGKAKALELVPLKATVSLNTVAKEQSSKDLRLAEPLGVVTFDPSFAGTYSQTRTQVLQISLDPQVTDKNSAALDPAGKYPIGQALAVLRDELLKVDHDRQPCLAYGDKSVIKLTVTFDVVSQSTGGFGLKLVAFKVGTSETTTAQASQSLEVLLALAGGQGMLGDDLK